MVTKIRNQKIKWIMVGLVAMILVFALASSVFAGSKLSLDKKGRYGCIACHGDSRLTKRVGNKTISLYVDENTYAKSVHGEISCLSCHTDFTFRDHSNGVNNYKKTAGLSCIRCHQHKKQYKTYIKSIHGKLAMSNSKKKGATCGDCHSYKIHEIQKTKEFKDDFFFNAQESCGKKECHKKYYDSYFDWYHGQAYKEKAVDSPACWNCHGAHDVYAKGEAQSKTSDNNLGASCGVCHSGSENSFGIAYKKSIHGKTKMNENNFLVKYYFMASDIGQGTVKGTKSMYTTATDWVASMYNFFFPESLRPIKENSEG